MAAKSNAASVSREVALLDEERALAKVKLPHGMKVKRRVTVPLVSTAHHPLIVVTIDGEMVRVPAPGVARSADGCLPTVAMHDAETGEAGNLILTTLVETAFKRCPGGYVGKTFAIVTGPTMPGKRYKQVEVFEVGQDGE